MPRAAGTLLLALLLALAMMLLGLGRAMAGGGCNPRQAGTDHAKHSLHAPTIGHGDCECPGEKCPESFGARR